MRRATLAARELSSLRNEKTIVLALLIQIVIAAFSSFLVVGLVSLYDPGTGQVEFAVTGDTDNLIEASQGENAWNLQRYPDTQTATQAFQSGDVDAVLIVEEGETSMVTVLAPSSDIRSTLIVSAARELLQRYEEQQRIIRANELRVSILTPPNAESTPYHGFTYAVLIPLLMFLPVFISGSIASDSITEEYQRGTLDLLRATPLSTSAVFDGKTITPIVIAPLQAALWLALLSLNDVNIDNVAALLVLVSSVTVITVGFGAAVAYRFKERKQAQFTYSVGVMAFFALTFALPESMPNIVAKLAAGSTTGSTYIFIALYAVVGVAIFMLTRLYVERHE